MHQPFPMQILRCRAHPVRDALRCRQPVSHPIGAVPRQRVPGDGGEAGRGSGGPGLPGGTQFWSVSKHRRVWLVVIIYLFCLAQNVFLKFLVAHNWGIGVVTFVIQSQEPIKKPYWSNWWASLKGHSDNERTIWVLLKHQVLQCLESSQHSKWTFCGPSKQQSIKDPAFGSSSMTIPRGSLLVSDPAPKTTPNQPTHYQLPWSHMTHMTLSCRVKRTPTN